MPCLHEPQPVYLYNRFPVKPWYLSGQVEVCRLMSALRTQMGVRATDRRLCPVSDWGLGLVTGIQFYRLAAPRSHTHTPALARWEAGMEGLIRCLDGSVGCLQWQRTHKDLEDHTHIHTGAHPAWCPLSCDVSALLTVSDVATLPKSPSDSLFILFFFLTKLKAAKCGVCVCTIQQDLIGFYRTC